MSVPDRCPRCGAPVMPDDKFCRQCAAPLTEAASITDGGAVHEGPPQTIEARAAFCQRNGMPLEKMRFFIDQDYREPRAFGIYRDGDRFVVYKNKADGSRAVRYHGPDEAYAVKELYDKLLDECHRRDIWPDGKPQGLVQRRRKQKRSLMLSIIITVVLIVAITAGVFIVDRHVHAHDGYYLYEDDYFYRYGDDWYCDYGGSWTEWDRFPDDNYDRYYLGDDYESSWQTGDFEKSEAWSRIQEESHTNSHDYDSWDSGDTNWSSDW